jgi:probable rRNA maturation factor
MYKSDYPVQFVFLAPCPLAKRSLLKHFITRIFKMEKVRLASLSIVFCTDGYLLRLNKQFLKHDYYTDILSFPLSDPGEPLEAEIYISIERVKENAINQNASFRQELHRVIFHGILHFCGYRDKSRAEVKQMRALEDDYLQKFKQQIKLKN